MNPALRIAFDVGGVLSRFPDEFFVLIETLRLGTEAVRRTGNMGGVEVFILSDMHPKEKVVAMLAANGYALHPDRVLVADYATHGELCKAVACGLNAIDILVDDHMGYVATPGSPPVRLLVMPDPHRPYYATGEPHWHTDGSEGGFGRRNPPGSKKPPEDRKGAAR